MIPSTAGVVHRPGQLDGRGRHPPPHPPAPRVHRGDARSSRPSSPSRSGCGWVTPGASGGSCRSPTRCVPCPRSGCSSRCRCGWARRSPATSRSRSRASLVLVAARHPAAARGHLCRHRGGRPGRARRRQGRGDDVGARCCARSSCPTRCRCCSRACGRRCCRSSRRRPSRRTSGSVGSGRYLIDGIALGDYPQTAGGAVLVAVLAVVLDGVFALVQRRAVSPGLTGGRRLRVGGRGKDSRSVAVEADRPPADAARPLHPPDPLRPARTSAERQTSTTAARRRDHPHEAHDLRGGTRRRLAPRA